MTYLLCAPVQEGPTFRFTTSEVTVQPSPCLSYRIPRDFVDLSTGEDAYKLIDFLKLVGFYPSNCQNRNEKKKNTFIVHWYHFSKAESIVSILC